MNFELIIVQSNGDQKYHADEAKTYVYFLHNYSGKLTIEVTQEKALVYIFGIYIGTKDDNFQLNTIQHHKVGQNISDLLIKGIFFSNSRFIYEGLIKIDKDAQQSNAYQKNQNLIMSDGVFVDSRPYLEILANDVRCTHGSTTGQLDKDQLFYLKTRGLSNEIATKLLLEGFVDDVFQKIQLLDDTLDISMLRDEVLGKLVTV